MFSWRNFRLKREKFGKINKTKREIEGMRKFANKRHSTHYQSLYQKKDKTNAIEMHLVVSALDSFSSYLLPLCRPMKMPGQFTELCVVFEANMDRVDFLRRSLL